jgi:hypothetical protein
VKTALLAMRTADLSDPETTIVRKVKQAHRERGKTTVLLAKTIVLQDRITVLLAKTIVHHATTTSHLAPII